MLADTVLEWLPQVLPGQLSVDEVLRLVSHLPLSLEDLGPRFLPGPPEEHFGV